MYPSDLADAQWAKLEVLLRESVQRHHAGGRPRKYPFAARDRRGAVRGQNGLPVAAVADRFSSLADGSSAVSGLAAAGALGTSNQSFAGAGPQNRRTQFNSYGGNHRFAVGQDHRKRGARGYDAGKKIKGRKRHIAVDTQGNPCRLGLRCPRGGSSINRQCLDLPLQSAKPAGMDGAEPSPTSFIVAHSY